MYSLLFYWPYGMRMNVERELFLAYWISPTFTFDEHFRRSSATTFEGGETTCVPTIW